MQVFAREENVRQVAPFLLQSLGQLHTTRKNQDSCYGNYLFKDWFPGLAHFHLRRFSPASSGTAEIA
jgi:hypothetical protein